MSLLRAESHVMLAEASAQDALDILDRLRGDHPQHVDIARSNLTEALWRIRVALGAIADAMAAERGQRDEQDTTD